MGPEALGYPPTVLVVVAVAGAALLAFHPRLLVPLTWAAILTVDNTAYTFTRIGQGFLLLNLYDLLLILGLLAGLRVCITASLPLLRLPAALGALLMLGLALTLLERELTYEDLRLFRFALVFAVALAIGILTGASRPGGLFLWILVGAVAFQSVRQCVYVIAFPDPNAAEASWRTLRFLNAGLAYVPLTLSLTAERLRPWRGAMLVAATVPAVVALVLTQTRSLWVPQAIVIVAALVWRVPRGRATVPLLIAGATAVAVIVGGRAFSGATEARVDLWALFAEGRAMDFSQGTGRETAIMAELSAWLEGNWLLGRGIGFQNGPGFDPSLAWGHNGYTGYLTNLGLVGLAVYGLVLPLVVLRSAVTLARRLDPADGLLGTVALATVGFCSIQGALTSGLLAGHVYSMYGMLAGAVLARAQPAGSPSLQRSPRRHAWALSGARGPLVGRHRAES